MRTGGSYRGIPLEGKKKKSPPPTQKTQKKRKGSSLIPKTGRVLF
jgi:hypothetical protein